MPLMEPRRSLMVRYEVAGGRIFISETTLRKWLVKQGVGISEFVKYLRDHKILIRESRRITLGAGTDFATGQTPTFEIDGHHPAVKGGLREVEEKLPEDNVTRAQRIANYQEEIAKR
jgi:hypothetical protein